MHNVINEAANKLILNLNMKGNIMTQATELNTATAATAEKAKKVKVKTEAQLQLEAMRAAVKAQRDTLKAMNAARKAERAAEKEVKDKAKAERAVAREASKAAKEEKRTAAIKRAEERLAKLKAQALGSVATAVRQSRPRKNGDVTVMRPDTDGVLQVVDTKAEKKSNKAKA